MGWITRSFVKGVRIVDDQVVISTVGVNWVKVPRALSRGAQMVFAAESPKAAGSSRARVVSACGHFGAETTRPGSPRGEWAEPSRAGGGGGGRARGGIVSAAPSCICLLEVLAERAWRPAAASWKCHRWPRPREETESEGPRARCPRPPAGRGVPAEQHADRRPAPCRPLQRKGVRGGAGAAGSMREAGGRLSSQRC